MSNDHGLVGGIGNRSESPADDGNAQTQQVKTKNKFFVVLMGRQSYDPNTNEYALIPKIDLLARTSAPTPIEAFELYQHFLELSDILNEEISTKVDEYNEAVLNLPDEDDGVVDTGEEDPSIDFASVFDPEENTFLESIAGRIRTGGYSQMSVYMQVSYGTPGDDETTTFQPESVADINRYS